MPDCPPNLVIFIPDQWRGDMMGHLGDPAASTPRLDRWVSEEALSFRNAFCQNPVCTPSRCSFMTGWYPHVRGHRSMTHLLRADEPCLLSDLRRNGYHVWWGGKNDLVAGAQGVAACCDERHHVSPAHPNLHADQSWRQGEGDFSFFAGRLDCHPGEKRYGDSDWLHVEGACEFIRNYREGEPFCAYIAIEYPHPPFGVEEPYFSRIDRGSLPPRVRSHGEGKPRLQELIRGRQNLGDREEREWDESRAVYRGMAARVDEQFGMVLDALRQSGHYDDTAVLFFSDHGEYAGDYGLVEKAQNLFEDCLVRVPLLVKPPVDCAGVPGIRDGMVELVDVAATVYDLAGITPAHHHFGRSLRPFFAGDPPGRDAVFCEGGIRAGEPLDPSATDKASLYWPRVSWSKDDPAAYGRAVMIRTATHKYILRGGESDELYDLADDPLELRNRVGDPALKAVGANLRERLLAFLWETADVVPWQTDPRDAPRD
jgi:arylsulfatase A-like enzyme